MKNIKDISFQKEVLKVKDQINKIIIDKEEELHLCLVSILSDGHMLLEGAPGMGKTSLVKSLVKLLGLDNSRIQFTNDMLPADILGASVFQSGSSEFKFHKGPLFSQFVLADEINRATPKTQSACLQAMEEAYVNIDGAGYELPKPFYIFATQNPLESIGTFPLPESQLDRFFMRVKIGLPTRKGEKDLLLNGDRNGQIQKLEAILSTEQLLAVVEEVKEVHVSDAVIEYILDLVEKTRVMAKGLSPRGSQDLVKAIKASAYLEGRDYCIPEDLQRVAVAVMNHRLGEDSNGFHHDSVILANEILKSVKVA